jgi:predicted Holliday junction resolvase-like endonuclease
MSNLFTPRETVIVLSTYDVAAAAVGVSVVVLVIILILSCAMYMAHSKLDDLQRDLEAFRAAAEASMARTQHLVKSNPVLFDTGKKKDKDASGEETKDKDADAEKENSDSDSLPKSKKKRSRKPTAQLEAEVAAKERDISGRTMIGAPPHN